jgi:hypothetical protein
VKHRVNYRVGDRGSASIIKQIYYIAILSILKYDISKGKSHRLFNKGLSNSFVFQTDFIQFYDMYYITKGGMFSLLSSLLQLLVDAKLHPFSFKLAFSPNIFLFSRTNLLFMAL